jgi:hypothetical protein
VWGREEVGQRQLQQQGRQGQWLQCERLGGWWVRAGGTRLHDVGVVQRGDEARLLREALQYGVGTRQHGRARRAHGAAAAAAARLQQHLDRHRGLVPADREMSAHE